MTAVRNLVNNAIKYSEKDGTVDISLKKADGSVVLTVQDHGCGMSEM